MKDFPADRLSPRERMAASLDEIFSVKISKKYARDAVESKLFGIGSESYVVGSHEFFMGYAVKNGLILTLDSGHFHPTETIADKISSMLMFVPELLLHVSRGVRWDSDHVVVSDDPTVAAMREVVRCGGLSRVHIGMDFFDASINRIFAWAIGMRAGAQEPAFWRFSTRSQCCARRKIPEITEGAWRLSRSRKICRPATSGRNTASARAFRAE